MAKEKILVVDDEDNIVELIKMYLGNEGYLVESASDGEAAIAKFHTERPELVILDIMLPGMDGWDVCREIRKKSSAPIIMLTAKDEEFDKVLGLELGADDYLTKPFSPRELVARVKAVLRRTAAANTPDAIETFIFGDLFIDFQKREVKVDEKDIELTAKEFDLLEELVRNKGIVYKREKLLEKVWGYDFYGDLRTVDVHIRHLREKLGETVEEPRFIETVWGVGYKFKGK